MMILLMKKKRGWSRNYDHRGARDFALWIGIGQKSRAGSGWVRQDVRAGLGRQALWEQILPQLLEMLFSTFSFMYSNRIKGLGKAEHGGAGGGGLVNILVGERFPKNRINGA